MKYLVTLFVWTTTFFVGLAQSPSHFFIGQSSLGNHDVYSILHTSNGRLLVATDAGVFEYQHNAFQPLGGELSATQLSQFGLVENNEGEIFCHNLQGEIFKIGRRQLQLYATIPREYVGRVIQLFISDLGELHYFSNAHLLRIDGYQKHTVLPLNSNGVTTGSLLSKLPSGKAVVATCDEENYLVFEEGEWSLATTGAVVGKNVESSYRSFFELNGKPALCDDFTIQFANSTGKTALPQATKGRFMAIDDEEVWGLNAVSGVTVIREVAQKPSVVASYFSETFISAGCVGKDGAIYLGTFGEGLLVIPSTAAFMLDTKAQVGKVRSMAVADDGRLFYNEMGRGIVTHLQSDSTILAEKKQRFNHLFWRSNARFGVAKDFPSLYHDEENGNASNGIPTVQDVVILDNGIELFATSKGLIKRGFDDQFATLNWTPFETPLNDLFHSKKLKNRTMALALDRSSKTLYASSLGETFAIEEKGEITPILYEGKSFSSRQLEAYNGKLWCISPQHGLLVVNDSNSVCSFSPNGIQEFQQAQQIELRNDSLFALINGKLHLYNLRSKSYQHFGVAEGIAGELSAFALSQSSIICLDERSRFTRLDLSTLHTKSPMLSVSLDSLRVEEETKHNGKPASFAHASGPYTFFVSHPHISLVNDVSIYYRVEGFQDKWEKLPKEKRSVTFRFLPPGRYRFEVKSTYFEQNSPSQSFEFDVLPPYWQRWWFIVLIGLVASSSIFFVFRARLRFLRKREREEARKRKMQSDLIEAELKALRSQMNPHFIFNTLHSIQSMVLSGDVDQSYDYITLFATLVRKVLNYSNKEYISMGNELEFIRVYLELEKLRFGDDLAYTIDFDGDKELQVPPLMVQPFVENALVHGLRHKKGESLLQLRFIKTKCMTCEVTDNGIGLKAAQQIRERKGEQHQSYALRAIKKRLELYPQNGECLFGFEVSDIVENDQLKGTKATLILPYREPFA